MNVKISTHLKHHWRAIINTNNLSVQKVKRASESLKWSNSRGESFIILCWHRKILHWRYIVKNWPNIRLLGSKNNRRLSNLKWIIDNIKFWSNIITLKHSRIHLFYSRPKNSEKTANHPQNAWRTTF